MVCLFFVFFFYIEDPGRENLFFGDCHWWTGGTKAEIPNRENDLRLILVMMWVRVHKKKQNPKNTIQTCDSL